jgi:acyl-CoA reductase-like NAD-dependent aldehyde dehydrogenase
MIAAAGLRNMAEAVPDQLAEREHAVGDARVRVGHRPLGVIAAIVPWNAPLTLAAQKLGPALAAGNGVVVKPSPVAPLAVARLVEIVSAELPAGLVGVVTGDGDVGTALVEHPLVRKVSFTGGGATARAIMATAAATLTRVHFELGGNDAALVLDDADAHLVATRLAQTAFRRAGQVCYAVKRVYLPASRAAEITEALLAAVSELAVGDATDPRTGMGPVADGGRFEHVAGLAAATAAAGRRVLDLGTALDPEAWSDGWFLPPRVVVDAEPGDEVVGVEQFGPILPLVVYGAESDAIAWANDTEYGLGSSVWSTDEERALAVAARLEAGLTFVNHHRLSPAGFRHAPFGGVKQSGMGWENAPVAISEYVDFHSVDIHPSG